MGTGYLNDVWVANFSNANLSKISNGNVADPINVGTCPNAVCVDKNNVVWVANYTSNNVSKIINGAVVSTIDVGIKPFGICVDKDNAVWVANFASNTIIKIENDEITATITGLNRPQGICVDKNNAIWVVNSGNNTVSKIENNTITAIIHVGVKTLYGICCDANNVIWVTGSTDSTVYKIINSIVSDTTIMVSSPKGICIDKNNAIWVTSSSGYAHKIVNDAIDKTVQVGVAPYGICCDAENTIWVANNTSCNITKIENNAATATIPVGDYPVNLGDATGMQAVILFGWSSNPAITVNKNIDTIRKTNITTSFSVDTKRQVYSNVNLVADTTRIIPFVVTTNTIGIKSVTIQTGIQSLSDRFIVESVGQSFSDTDNFRGEIAGFKFDFEQATTSENNGFSGTTYSVTGRPDMAEFLFGEVDKVVLSQVINGGRVINATAKQLCAMVGVDASNITDFTPIGIGTYDDKYKWFRIKEKSKKSFLDRLFGWSSDFAYRQIYYTNRNGNIVVGEVGKYTKVYNLSDESKYRIENCSIQRQRIRKFVDKSTNNTGNPTKTPGKYVHKPEVINIPFSGNVQFGDSALFYSNGLLLTETTSDSTTEYKYQYYGNQNVIKSKISIKSDNLKRSTTTYNYSNVDASGRTTETYSLADEHVLNEVYEKGDWVTDTEHKVIHVPIGNGFYGQRVVEIDKEDHTTVATSISRGTPGGSASLYTIQQKFDAVKWEPGTDNTVNDFDGELRNNVNIAVAEVSIVNDLIEIINWQNGKKEETISLSLIVLNGADLVDAVGGAVSYRGNLYYIQTTSAVVNDKGTRQQVSAVRWY